MPTPMLDVKGLETQFKTPEGIVHAVNGVSFSLDEGENWLTGSLKCLVAVESSQEPNLIEGLH